MKAKYHREICPYSVPHIVCRPNGHEILARYYIKSIVSVDNGKHWYYLGEDTDYPCGSFQHALDMLDEFFWQDMEINYEMNPVIWNYLKKEEIPNPFKIVKGAKKMKRTKQTQIIVDNINNYLRNNHVKSQGDPVFVVMSYALINANVYQGYNYFTAEGYLSGGDNEKFDHLEFH